MGTIVQFAGGVTNIFTHILTQYFYSQKYFTHVESQCVFSEKSFHWSQFLNYTLLIKKKLYFLQF